MKDEIIPKAINYLYKNFPNETFFRFLVIQNLYKF